MASSAEVSFEDGKSYRVYRPSNRRNGRQPRRVHWQVWYQHSQGIGIEMHSHGDGGSAVFFSDGLISPEVFSRLLRSRMMFARTKNMSASEVSVRLPHLD